MQSTSRIDAPALRDLCSGVGNSRTTFMRWIGSYPIIVAGHDCLPANEFAKVRIIGCIRGGLVGECITTR